MPLGRINGGLQGELPFSRQSLIAIRCRLLSWLFRVNCRSPRLYGRHNGLPLLHGRHKGLPLPFAIPYSLPFDQSPFAIPYSLPFDQSPVAIR